MTTPAISPDEPEQVEGADASAKLEKKKRKRKTKTLQPGIPSVLQEALSALGKKVQKNFPRSYGDPLADTRTGNKMVCGMIM